MENLLEVKSLLCVCKRRAALGVEFLIDFLMKNVVLRKFQRLLR